MSSSSLSTVVAPIRNAMKHPTDTESEEKLPAGDFAKCVLAIVGVDFILGLMLGPTQIGTSTGAGVLLITAVPIGTMAAAVALAYRDVLRACRCCRGGGTASKITPASVAASDADSNTSGDAGSATAGTPPAHVLLPAPAVHPAAGPDAEYLADSAPRRSSRTPCARAATRPCGRSSSAW